MWMPLMFMKVFSQYGVNVGSDEWKYQIWSRYVPQRFCCATRHYMGIDADTNRGFGMPGTELLQQRKVVNIDLNPILATSSISLGKPIGGINNGLRFKTRCQTQLYLLDGNRVQSRTRCRISFRIETLDNALAA